MDSQVRREAATARYRQAADAVGAVFDRLDELRAVIDQACARPGGDDPVADAEALTAAVGKVGDKLVEVRSAAVIASEFEPKGQLADAVGVRKSRLFPPQPRGSVAPPPPPAAAEWTDGSAA